MKKKNNFCLKLWVATGDWILDEFLKLSRYNVRVDEHPDTRDEEVSSTTLYTLERN